MARCYRCSGFMSEYAYLLRFVKTSVPKISQMSVVALQLDGPLKLYKKPAEATTGS